jgi:hypothetical protein
VCASEQRLCDGGVFRIDGDNLARRRSGGNERPADDQRLFVGERQGRARRERRKGWFEADRTGDSVENDVCR